MLKSLAIAFSMYSALPVPQFEWKEKEMRYAILFFPFVGAVCGILTLAFGWVCSRLGAHTLTRTAGTLVIPCLVSGGIHVDGFMDTSDALSSHRSKEERLAILKDPHIGAFAVIRLLVLAGAAFGAVASFNEKAFAVLAAGFFLSRACSAYAVVAFPCANRKGSLYAFSEAVDKRRARIVLMLEIAAAAVLMITAFPLAGVFAVAAAGAVFVYYKVMSEKYFGGITGDIAGWFVCVCEVWMMIALALGSLLAG